MHGVREQAPGRAGVVGAAWRPHLFALSWKSTGRPPGHRRPVGLCRCVDFLRSCSWKQSFQEPGTLKGPSTYA